MNYGELRSPPRAKIIYIKSSRKFLLELKRLIDFRFCVNICGELRSPPHDENTF